MRTRETPSELWSKPSPLGVLCPCAASGPEAGSDVRTRIGLSASSVGRVWPKPPPPSGTVSPFPERPCPVSPCLARNPCEPRSLRRELLAEPPVPRLPSLRTLAGGRLSLPTLRRPEDRCRPGRVPPPCGDGPSGTLCDPKVCTWLDRSGERSHRRGGGRSRFRLPGFVPDPSSRVTPFRQEQTYATPTEFASSEHP